MNKREIAGQLDASEIIGTEEVSFDLLIECSSIIRYKYTFLSSSKKQVLRDIEQFFNMHFLIYSLGDSTWLLKPHDESTDVYTLIREM